MSVTSPPQPPAVRARLWAAPPPGARLAVCADVGSTDTKLAVVDVSHGSHGSHGMLVATANHPTTVGTDVLDGLDAAVAAVAALLPGCDLRRRYACSSAGGGLRLAVVGYEQLVSAEAGHRVAGSAGARVMHVAAGRLTGADVARLRAARPDVVLLVGGTDGGDAEVLRHNGQRLASARLRVPVVVAGNVDVRDEVARVLAGRGVPVVATGNVLPRIGVLDPGPARSAIREVFLRHVIGGKKLSRGTRFASMVRGATPDVVLTAVELWAGHRRDGGDLLVVDVGGATTDVYSAVAPDPEGAAGVRAEVAGSLWCARTVEGDLGVRGGAVGVVAAARAEKLVDEAEADRLDEVAAGLAGGVVAEGSDPLVERRLARLAAVVAVRRHARGEPVAGVGSPRRGGRDLRGVRLVVGSGGVLRYASQADGLAVVAAVTGDQGGGWRVPRQARLVVDEAYVLAPAGLLAADEPAAALALLRRHLDRW